MPKKRYVLDPTNLQFRHHRLPWNKKLINFSLWFSLSIAVAFVYNSVYNHFFESAKVTALNQEIEIVKLKFNLLNKEMDSAQSEINNFVLSDDKRYRPILNLDTLSESSRHPGYGGIERYTDLAGFSNSSVMIKSKTKIADLKNEVNAQATSFNLLESEAAAWKTRMDHLPYMWPVKGFILGDRVGFRPIHPVTGELGVWHHGQDISVPTGTQVYATGEGKVVSAGWIGGFGNGVVIDHGYGFKTTYAHLSRIDVPEGMNVKRGDQIGLSGSTGSSTGPHLHYQIELFGKTENPLSYFTFDMTDDEYSEMIKTLNTGRY
jgi:murein DD-endopeptidase MepM/ murein hydrolase activator NlpD